MRSSGSSPPVQDPYFDASRDAWVLSRYLDVLAAFHEPLLWPAGSSARSEETVPDEIANARVRSETLEALAPGKISSWAREIEPLAATMFGELARDRPVDLVKEFLRPWCLRLSSLVTGVSVDDAVRLASLSSHVAAAAADPDDAGLRARAKEATAELKPFFPTGPAPLREAGYVALSETLLRLLANMWYVLLRDRDAFARLRQSSEAMSRAIEEMMRHAGLARALYRTATDDLSINGLEIRKGQRIVLCPRAANHDPAQFAEPDRLDFDRKTAGHFSLGNGPHSCTGAALLRMAATVATRALVTSCSFASLSGPVEWEGGSGFQSPKQLVVVLRNEPA